jgi:hypothetical protein
MYEGTLYARSVNASQMSYLMLYILRIQLQEVSLANQKHSLAPLNDKFKLIFLHILYYIFSLERFLVFNLVNSISKKLLVFNLSNLPNDLRRGDVL